MVTTSTPVVEADRETQIAKSLADGADPLATVAAGGYTAHEHRDNFSYLIGMTEMAARQEEAGADYLPDNWRVAPGAIPMLWPQL